MNKILHILKNPFAVIEDRKLLAFGIISFISGVCLAYFFEIQMQILRVNPLKTPTLIESFIGHLIIVLALTAMLYSLGKFINKKTRLLDVINVALISMTPLYLIFFENFNGFMYKQTQRIEEAIRSGNLMEFQTPVLLIVTSILSVLILIYFIYLLFVGFKTVVHAKKTWQYFTFFGLLIITDLICSYLINSI